MLASPLMLFSCSGTSLYSEGDGELKIVASSFPAFDLARQTAKDTATVTLLQSSGADLHNYTPSAQALAALTEADIFICNGGISDQSWIDDTLLAADNPDLVIIKMVDFAQPLLTELEGHGHSEYCHENHPHDHSHEHDHSHGDGHGHESDEHVWMSLRAAIGITRAISDACSAKLPKNAALYQANAEKYVAQLEALDASYESVINASSTKTLVCADRFPFIYLTSDYEICYYAAFSGCSSESEASFETFVTLAEAIKANGLSYVIITENGDTELASALSEQTGCKILPLNSMQSVTAAEISKGVTYLRIMQDNLAIIEKIL